MTALGDLRVPIETVHSYTMSEEKSFGFGFESFTPKAEEPKVEEIKEEVKAEKPKKKKAEPKKVEAKAENIGKPVVKKAAEAEVLYGANKIRAKRAKRGA